MLPARRGDPAGSEYERAPEEPENERAAAFPELRGWDRERAKAWERDTELLLREREMNRRRGSGRVELPTHLTVSSLVTLASDPKALARQIRRPVPKKPTPLAARRGRPSTAGWSPAGGSSG